MLAFCSVLWKLVRASSQPSRRREKFHLLDINLIKLLTFPPLEIKCIGVYFTHGKMHTFQRIQTGVRSCVTSTVINTTGFSLPGVPSGPLQPVVSVVISALLRPAL